MSELKTYIPFKSSLSNSKTQNGQWLEAVCLTRQSHGNSSSRLKSASRWMVDLGSGRTIAGQGRRLFSSNHRPVFFSIWNSWQIRCIPVSQKDYVIYHFMVNIDGTKSEVGQKCIGNIAGDICLMTRSCIIMTIPNFG